MLTFCSNDFSTSSLLELAASASVAFPGVSIVVTSTLLGVCLSVFCDSSLVGVLRVVTCTRRGVFCSGVLHLVEGVPHLVEGVLDLSPEVEGVTGFTSEEFTLFEGVEGFSPSFFVEGVFGGVDTVVTWTLLAFTSPGVLESLFLEVGVDSRVVTCTRRGVFIPESVFPLSLLEGVPEEEGVVVRVVT